MLEADGAYAAERADALQCFTVPSRMHQNRIPLRAQPGRQSRHRGVTLFQQVAEAQQTKLFRAFLRLRIGKAINGAPFRSEGRWRYFVPPEEVAISGHRAPDHVNKPGRRKIGK